MNAFDVRSALRLHRFEIVGGALLLAVVAAVAWWLAWQLDLTGYGRSCSLDGTNTPDCAVRGAAFFGLQQTAVPLARLALLAVPMLVAPLIGVAVVGRDLERGTARLAWSIAPSRVVWFLRRVVPVTLVVLVAGLVAGLVADRMFGAVDPWLDPNHAMVDLGSRGLPFAARVVFVLAIGVFVGAVTGRTLPALLITAVVATVGLSGGSLVHERILRSEAVWVETTTGAPDFLSGDRLVEQRLRLPDGRLVDDQAAYEAYPPPADGPNAEWIVNTFPRVDLVIPGSHYPVAAAREAAVLGLASLGLLAATALVVTRRRPG